MTRFFHTPGWPKDYCESNVLAVGQLSWPKNFYAVGLELVLTNAVSDRGLAHSFVQFHIGEKVYFTSPLMLMRKRDGGKRFFSTFYETSGTDIPDDPQDVETPVQLLQEINQKNLPGVVLHIEPVRVFAVSLTTNRDWGVTQDVKLQLLGGLGREIQ
jgi:hypothetical protein